MLGAIAYLADDINFSSLRGGALERVRMCVCVCVRAGVRAQSFCSWHRKKPGGNSIDPMATDFANTFTRAHPQTDRQTETATATATATDTNTNVHPDPDRDTQSQTQPHRQTDKYRHTDSDRDPDTPTETQTDRHGH